MRATIEDLLLERWLRRRNSGKICQVSKDGKETPIKDMSDAYLENAINCLCSYQDEDSEIIQMLNHEDAGDRV